MSDGNVLGTFYQKLPMEKRRNIWVGDQIIVGNQALNKLHRDVPGNTDLLKVSRDIYSPHYCYACH